MPNAPHSDRQRHGWSPVPVIVVTPRAPRVLTRAEVAGLADQEKQINRLYDHASLPNARYWQTELARLDATLATQGAAA